MNNTVVVVSIVVLASLAVFLLMKTYKNEKQFIREINLLNQKIDKKNDSTNLDRLKKEYDTYKPPESSLAEDLKKEIDNLVLDENKLKDPNELCELNHHKEEELILANDIKEDNDDVTDVEVVVGEDEVVVSEDNDDVTDVEVVVSEDEVVVSEDEVVVGEDEVVVGEDEVVVGEDEVVVGEDEVVVGEDEVVVDDVYNFEPAISNVDSVYKNINFENLDSMTLKELQNYAREHNIKIKGKKIDLIDRIKEQSL